MIRRMISCALPIVQQGIEIDRRINFCHVLTGQERLHCPGIKTTLSAGVIGSSMSAGCSKT